MGKSLQKNNKAKYQRNFRDWDSGLEELWVKCKALIELETGKTKVNSEVMGILMERFIATSNTDVTI